MVAPLPPAAPMGIRRTVERDRQTYRFREPQDVPVQVGVVIRMSRPATETSDPMELVQKFLKISLCFHIRINHRIHETAHSNAERLKS